MVSRRMGLASQFTRSSLEAQNGPPSIFRWPSRDSYYAAIAMPPIPYLDSIVFTLGYEIAIVFESIDCVYLTCCALLF
jgi:hypothetical protein